MQPLSLSLSQNQRDQIVWNLKSSSNQSLFIDMTICHGSWGHEERSIHYITQQSNQSITTNFTVSTLSSTNSVVVTFFTSSASRWDERRASDQETCQPALENKSSCEFPLSFKHKGKTHRRKRHRYLRPVWNPDASDFVGDTRVGQGIDPSFDESLLPEGEMTDKGSNSRVFFIIFDFKRGRKEVIFTCPVRMNDISHRVAWSCSPFRCRSTSFNKCYYKITKQRFHKF